MRNILLVEPDYRSKFPPLGLMRLSAYHRARGDAVTFVRGNDPLHRGKSWHRVYVSSLFTWELPRTVRTLRYYRSSVEAAEAMVVGGVGVSLLPQYVRERVHCRILTGLVDAGGELDPHSPPLTSFIPDYRLLKNADYGYTPKDAYFLKITSGCTRKCKFCAVPILEPRFGFSAGVTDQITRIATAHGEMQDLVVMDNNILATDGLEGIFAEIRDCGFAVGAKRNNKKRNVDFNQGLDCRLVDRQKASLLASVCASPLRLAFDHDAVEKPYRAAIALLAANGIREFTNYLLFNFVDDPASLYRRMRVNLELNEALNLAITAFPMRYIPMNDVNRRHVSEGWTWRYLRGMQCILLATHGLVSPNPVFFERAFGSSVEQFLEIIAMPDRYIVWRAAYETDGADDWRIEYRKLSPSQKAELHHLLATLNRSRSRAELLASANGYRSLLDHYYPGGKAPANKPPDSFVATQGL